MFSDDKVALTPHPSPLTPHLQTALHEFEENYTITEVHSGVITKEEGGGKTADQ